MLDRPVARSAHLDGRVSASVARRPIEPGLRSTTLRPTCTFAVTSSPAWSSAKVVAHSWRAALLVVVLLAVGCGDASLVGAPAAATDVPTASPVAAVTTPPTATTIRELMAGRDSLFADEFYHVDVSHLSSVVQMSLHLSPSEGKSRDVGGAIMEMLYPPGTPARRLPAACSS